MKSTRFAADTVKEWTPVTFAVAFTRKMRKRRDLALVPSLRTTLAIPKFLSARYFRLHQLNTNDYLQAAVLCTAPEDQQAADQVARELLFKKDDKGEGVEDADEITVSDTVEEDDATASLLSSLEEFDLDSFDDLDALDALLSDDEESTEPTAFDLFEKLFSSADSGERALAELVSKVGGPAELEAADINTVEDANSHVGEELKKRAGDYSPEEMALGADAGFADQLAQDAQHPWELAAALAAQEDNEALQTHLNDLLDTCGASTWGRCLKYLDHFAGDTAKHQPTAEVIEQFHQDAMQRASTLNECAEVMVGHGQWRDLPDDILRVAAENNLASALRTAEWLRVEFGNNLSPALFDHWLAHYIGKHGKNPDLNVLSENIVDCPAWQKLARQGLKDFTAAMNTGIKKSGTAYVLPTMAVDAVHIAERLAKSGVTSDKELL